MEHGVDGLKGAAGGDGHIPLAHSSLQHLTGCIDTLHMVCFITMSECLHALADSAIEASADKNH